MTPIGRPVGFGTRHTASLADHPTREIGAARAWFGDEMKRIASRRGGCIAVSSIERSFTNARLPNGANAVDVLGIQRGRDPNASSSSRAISTAASAA